MPRPIALVDAATRLGVYLYMASLIAGCALPYAKPQLDPEDVPFLGIQHALSAHESPDVLLVHGMCTHTPSDLQDANAALGKALQMKPDQSKDVVLHPEWGKQDGAQLFSSTLTDGTHSVRTYSLLWSPIVTGYKRARLCYDVSDPNGSCTRDEATYDKSRAAINRLAKDVLLDDCLADATFYMGSKGSELLRDAALRAVITTLAGGQNAASSRSEALRVAAARKAPFFMITHSLGSKITADALDDVRDAALTSALGRTYQIFMEANQLPMLSVGSRSSSEGPQTAAAEPDSAMQALIDRILVARRENGPRELTDHPLVIVAFSDPNDLLTWGLRKSAVQFRRATVVDAWVSNSPTVFGTFENPLAAHVGYARNRAVARLIACGWKMRVIVGACE